MKPPRLEPWKPSRLEPWLWLLALLLSLALSGCLLRPAQAKPAGSSLAASIARGQADWQSAPLVSATTGLAIHGRCASCHFDDAGDIKAVGARRILARARIHGLTVRQGADIAAYALSQPGPAIDPDTPLFQPAPGLDRRPANQWIRGGGDGAVLAQDADMVPEVLAAQQAGNFLNATGRLNLRELPVPLRLMTLREMWPTIAPEDAYPTFSTSEFASTYANLLTQLENPDPAYHAWFARSADAPLYHLLGYWVTTQTQFLYPLRPRVWTAADAEKQQSLADWHVIKELYVMQHYGLWDAAPSIWPQGGEARSGLSASLFDASPFMLGIPPGIIQPRGAWERANNRWYYTQIVVDAGNGHRQGWWPVDWGYALGHIKDLSNTDRAGYFLLAMTVTTKAMQQADTNGTVDSTFGWFPVWTFDPDDYTNTDKGSGYGYQIAEAQGLPGAAGLGPMLTAAITGYMDKMEAFSPQAYYASGLTSATEPVGSDSKRMVASFWYATHPDEWHASLAGEGVDPAAVQRMRDWAQGVWPGLEWSTP